MDSLIRSVESHSASIWCYAPALSGELSTDTKKKSARNSKRSRNTTVVVNNSNSNSKGNSNLSSSNGAAGSVRSEDIIGRVGGLTSGVLRDSQYFTASLFQRPEVKPLQLVDEREFPVYAHDVDISKVWSKQDHNLLVNLVESEFRYADNGSVDWSHVAARIGGDKNSFDCFIQYSNCNSSINNNPWTREEELKLNEIADCFGASDWCSISETLGTNRTPIQCLRHYQQHINKGLVKSSNWDSKEDQALKQALEIFEGGKNQWQSISSLIPGRSPIQCLHRTGRALDCNENLVMGPWSAGEDERLLLAVSAYGIKTLNESKFPEEELRKLLMLNSETAQLSAAANKHHQRYKDRELVSISSAWKKIAECVPGRNEHSCRERYSHIDPDKSFKAFSEEEDDIIRRLVSIFGFGKWSTIANYMPNRTDRQISDRYKSIADKKDVQCNLENSKKRKKMSEIANTRAEIGESNNRASKSNNELSINDLEHAFHISVPRI